MNFEDLTPEQMEEARACETPGDARARDEGRELSIEELEGVSGGIVYDMIFKKSKQSGRI